MYQSAASRHTKHPDRQQTGRATTAAIQQELKTTLDSSKPSPASGAARQRTTARSDEARENKRRLYKRVARTMTDYPPQEECQVAQVRFDQTSWLKQVLPGIPLQGTSQATYRH